MYATFQMYVFSVLWIAARKAWQEGGPPESTAEEIAAAKRASVMAVALAASASTTVLYGAIMSVFMFHFQTSVVAGVVYQVTIVLDMPTDAALALIFAGP